MKRFMIVWLVCLIVTGQAIPAAAHNVALMATTSVDRNGMLTIKLADMYGAAIESVKVTLSVQEAGAKGEKTQRMKETAPGTYSVQIASGNAPLKEVGIKAVFQEELFFAAFRVDITEGMSERILPLLEVGPAEETSPWLYVGLGGAGLLALTGLGWGIRHRKQKAV